MNLLGWLFYLVFLLPRCRRSKGICWRWAAAARLRLIKTRLIKTRLIEARRLSDTVLVATRLISTGLIGVARIRVRTLLAGLVDKLPFLILGAFMVAFDAGAFVPAGNARDAGAAARAERIARLIPSQLISRLLIPRLLIPGLLAPAELLVPAKRRIRECVCRGVLGACILDPATLQ